MKIILFQLLLIIVITHLVIFSSGELDLQEANVTNVIFENLNDGNYNFVVTLYHDDDNEDGYADFWQIEKLDGTVLGKRILTHAHGTIEFTREKIINIPENVTIVVVRGHDQIHNFGGQVIILDLKLNLLDYVNQGSESLDFTNYQKNSAVITDVHSTKDENTTTSDLNFLILELTMILLLIGASVFRRYKK